MNNDGIREIIIATNYGLVGFESDASLGFDERGALINNFVYKRITSPDQVISGISSVSFVDIDNNVSIYVIKKRALTNLHLKRGF